MGRRGAEFQPSAYSAAGDAFDFGLDLRAHAHLRIDEFAVDLAELVGQRDLRVCFLGRIDPQIVQTAQRIAASIF